MCCPSRIGRGSDGEEYSSDSNEDVIVVEGASSFRVGAGLSGELKSFEASGRRSSAKRTLLRNIGPGCLSQFPTSEPKASAAGGDKGARTGDGEE